MSWRAYQQDVLDRLDQFLHDGHVHIVSAPGSGKTVLGLEIIRRLGLPTIVFSPTTSIREQWINRLEKDFLPEGSTHLWLSSDIRNPDYLTVSTYQALSVVSQCGEDFTALIDSLKRQEVRVIVVDEAHHLRAHWWKCLNELKGALDNPLIVSLTATPPIDVSQAEWNRYSSFCGEVDIEVNVPELVRSETLCPHQDFIYLNQPTEEEFSVFNTFSTEVRRLILDLELDNALATALLEPQSAWLPEKQSRSFARKNQFFFLSLCIYLRNTTAQIPPELFAHYELQGEELPISLSLEQAEILLQGLIYDFKEKLSDTVAHSVERYQKRLLQIGAIEKKKVQLKGTYHLEKILKSSPAKLHSVSEIVGAELSSLGRQMRVVILADYIRKEALDPHRDITLSKLGVAPIFQLLRRMKLRGLSLAMLTGSLVIVPLSLKEALQASKARFQISELILEPLPQDDTYAYLEVMGSERTQLILLLTELFQNGDLNCLVGTAALLGEGWDAPCLNTLILATYVGSFVMSNQMRGRAMRRDPAQPDKVANIWHLATVVPEIEDDSVQQDDLRKLNKRFEHFYGVGRSEEGVCITSGLGRMDLKNVNDFRDHNRKVLHAAAQKTEMAELWKSAFSKLPADRFLRPIREVMLPSKIVSTRFITHISGKKKTGIRHSFGRYLLRQRLMRIASVILELLQEKKTFPNTFKERHIRLSESSKHLSISLPEATEKDQKLYTETLETCFNPFYTARYVLVKGSDFIMIPKQLSALTFNDALGRNLFSSYGFYSTQSQEGQTEITKIRQEYLLKGENTYSCHHVKKWR